MLCCVSPYLHIIGKFASWVFFIFSNERRRLSDGCLFLAQDIVIAVLGDSWSEVRKLGATHARSLAAAFGPHEVHHKC